MHSPEFGTRKEKEQFVGYAHNFERYVTIDSQQLDRLALALQHGFLSPQEAQRLGVPHKKNLNITLMNFKGVDNIIYLFPLRGINQIPHWSNAVSVVFDQSLEVLSYEEMKEYQGGSWPHLSFLYGEVYVFGRIDPLRLKQILLPNPSAEEIEQTRGLVRKYVPTIADRITVA